MSNLLYQKQSPANHSTGFRLAELEAALLDYNNQDLAGSLNQINTHILLVNLDQLPSEEIKRIAEISKPFLKQYFTASTLPNTPLIPLVNLISFEDLKLFQRISCLLLLSGRNSVEEKSFFGELHQELETVYQQNISLMPTGRLLFAKNKEVHYLTPESFSIPACLDKDSPYCYRGYNVYNELNSRRKVTCSECQRQASQDLVYIKPLTKYAFIRKVVYTATENLRLRNSLDSLSLEKYWRQQVINSLNAYLNNNIKS